LNLFIYLKSKIMLTDNEIRLNGYKALQKKLGNVMAERFILLVAKEPFDYTEWQKDLWNDKSIEEISANAMKLRVRK